jgi:hypothetical protein
MTEGDETMIFWGNALMAFQLPSSTDSNYVMNRPSHVIQLLGMVISEAARIALIMLHPFTARRGIGIVKCLKVFLRV